ncbi:MAG: PilZ domain-containing protein [Acidobacteriales bacterium]|nr:PilZ domain-containing protein [Terriglobales bacterium]
MGTLTAPGIGQKKLAARAAVVGLEAGAGKLLQQCFGEFQINVVPLDGELIEQRLEKEKFEALVLRLTPETQSLIERARNSRANKRVVVYGIAKNTQEAIPYSRFGINALFEEKWLQQPMDRQAVLKVLRATYLLVAQEFRRYVRVPIVAEVTAQAGAQRFTAYTTEISAGGMSMEGAPKLAIGQQLQLSFSLPTGENVSVSASVCWLRASDSGLGARFDPLDDRRNLVRDWVEKYLEVS